MRAENVPTLAIDTFRHYWERLRDGETGFLGRDAIDPVETLPDSEELGGYLDRGAEALGRAVVVKLNGGLGTSMGMESAKSLLEVRDGDSFLDLTAKQVLHLRREHHCELPLVLMNSFRTQEDSLAALGRYPELDVGLPLDFLQNKVPKVLTDDLSPAVWPEDPSLEWCPPGHGDIYTALHTSGMLDTLLARGYEYAFLANGDNLGAVLDLSILGWFAEEKAPFLMEVADRTEADKKGGHLARRRDGRLELREVAQCPEDELDEFQDVSLYRYFNTNTLWVSLSALARALEESGGVLGLPMIRNAKRLDPRKEDSPAVLQLETAMGAAISVFEGARALRVPRARFVPVKTTNDLLGLWSDVWRTTEDHRLVPAGSQGVGELVVDLDPRYYRLIGPFQERFPHGAPSLADCRRLTVRGDVFFGADVVVRGDVTIEHDGPEPRVIPDGEVFG
jgi:UTP--glucose-1-phosphate uridylyltransferase